jgi:hypothetical protein
MNLLYLYPIGLGSLVVLLTVILIKRWRAMNETYTNAVERERNDTFFEEPEVFLNQGYVFCTLFSIRDIEACAVDMGLCLTRLEQIKVVALIKQEFNPHRGINCQTIREAIVRLQTIHTYESGFEDYEN